MLQHLQIRIRDKHCCFRDYTFSKTVFQDIFSCVIWLVVCLIFDVEFLFYWSELQVTDRSDRLVSCTLTVGWRCKRLTGWLTVLSHYSMPSLNTLYNTHTHFSSSLTLEWDWCPGCLCLTSWLQSDSDWLPLEMVCLSLDLFILVRTLSW